MPLLTNFRLRKYEEFVYSIYIFFNYHFGNRNYESITKIVPFLFSKCFLERHVHTMLRVKEQERELVREVVPQQRVKSSKFLLPTLNF